MNFKTDIFSLVNDMLATWLHMQLFALLNVIKSVNISSFSTVCQFTDRYFKER